MPQKLKYLVLNIKCLKLKLTYFKRIISTPISRAYVQQLKVPYELQAVLMHLYFKKKAKSLLSYNVVKSKLNKQQQYMLKTGPVSTVKITSVTDN